MQRLAALRSFLARPLMLAARWLTRGLDRDWCDVCNDCTPHASGKRWRQCTHCGTYVEAPDVVGGAG